MVQRKTLMEQLQKRLDGGCVDFSQSEEERDEGVAMSSEEALEQYLESGGVSAELTGRLISQRKVFPCWFGSALKLEGVSEFLEGLECYAPVPAWQSEFGAKVFKITLNQGFF